MKKSVLMIFALAMMLPFGNASAQTVFTCEHFTVTLPDGFEETWNSNDVLNAKVDADDVLFTATYSDESPDANELEHYADNMEWMVKSREGGKVLSRTIEGNQIIIVSSYYNEWEDEDGETHVDSQIDQHYLLLFPNEVCLIGKLGYPQDKAEVYDGMLPDIIKSFQLK